MAKLTGTLILAGVPIGNVEDASPRLRSTLELAEVIVAEDTRKVRRLLTDLGISSKARLISNHDQNETQRANELLALLQHGVDLVLVTDAGMPTVSDPGYRLAQLVAEQGGRVFVVPGPSAVTAALAVSGLPTDRFCFEGFLSRKSGERKRQLDALAHESRTMVFFEAPHRIAETLMAMAEVFGEDRRAVMCREITKLHEEIVRGSLADLIERCKSEVLGEITVVVQGKVGTSSASSAELLAAVADREAAGIERKIAISEVAKEFGIAKRDLFNLVVTNKGQKDD